MDQSYVCYFTMTPATGPRVSHIIDKAKFILGRSQSVDVPILLASVSREHLRVEIVNDTLLITDLGSANGTFIDGEPLAPQTPTLINSDQSLQMGSEESTFQFFLLNRPQEMSALENVRNEMHTQLSTSLRDAELAAKEELNLMKKAIEQQGQQTALKALHAAQAEAQKLLDESHNESHRIKTEASHQAKLLLENANLKAQQAKMEAANETHALMEQFQKKSSELKQKNQMEAQLILQEAHKKSLEQQVHIDLQLEKLTDIARTKSIEILRQAEENANQIVMSANEKALQTQESAEQKAQEIRKKAQIEALEINQRASEKSENLILSAQNEVQEKIRSRLAEHENLLNQQRKKDFETLEKEKLAFLSEAKKEAHNEQKNIISSYLNEIEVKKQEQRSIDTELLNLSRQREELSKNIQNLETEQENQVQKNAEKVEHHKLLENQLKDQQATLLKLSKAEEREKELKEQAQELTQKINTLQSQFEFEQQKTQESHSALVNQLLLAQEKKKEELQSELHQKKLALMKQLDQEHHQEEQRLKQLRKHQITDIARSIELKLIEKLENLFPNQPLEKLSDLSTAIFEIVTHHMSQQTSHVEIQTQVQKENVDYKHQKRNILLKRVGIFSAASAAVFLFFFRAEVLSTYRHLVKSNVAKEFAEERRKLGEFKPPQDDVYRNNYLENVIYYKNYTQLKLNPENIQAWTKFLSDVDFLTRHDLSEEDIIYFVAAETNMIKRLESLKEKIDKVYLKEELERAHSAEAEDLVRLVRILKTEENLKLVKSLEKDFFQKLRSPASK